MQGTDIRYLGGEPSDVSGVWGSFVEAIEGGAKMLGQKAAISEVQVTPSLMATL